MDPYFAMDGVSNSTLSYIKNYFTPNLFQMDKDIRDKAYAFGTLIDALITEPEKVNHFNRTVGRLDFNKQEFETALRMKDACLSDPFCAEILPLCEFQRVSVVEQFAIDHDGIEFSLKAKCKWDIFVEGFDLSGDIKSTSATTQQEFENAVNFFDYDRQRAWYMDLEHRSNDILIGISKVNYKVFKVPVKKGSNLYNSGRAKYQELAFKYWYLYS